VLGVIALSLLVVATGVLAWRARASSRHTPFGRVLVFGDSITDISASMLHERFDPSFTMTVSGVGGARATERVASAQELTDRRPEQLIIELGTNDVLQGTSLDDAIGAVTKIATSFPGLRCVHVVNINEQMVSFSQPDLPQRAADMNRRIRAAAEQHGWDVVEWNTIVDRYEAAHEPDGPLTTDTVHPTAIGQELLANAYDDVMQGCR